MAIEPEHEDQEMERALKLHRRYISEEQWQTFEGYVTDIFTAFGLDLHTPATYETPRRFLRAMFDATEGYEGDPKLLKVFETECRGGPDCRLSQVIEGPIHFFSLCEHHALTGVADWSDFYDTDLRVGFLHGLLNGSIALTYLASWLLRRTSRRRAGIAVSTAGYLTALFSAYLGGELVFAKGAGVNHDAFTPGSDEYIAVMDVTDLAEGKLTRVDVAGIFPPSC